MTKATPESDILEPRDPSLDELTDEWPELTLENVYAHLPGDNKATTSVLGAAAGFPLTLVGQLEPLDDEDAHLYKKAPIKKRTTIVLENVHTFSYGQYGDGSTAIWAAGKAGWFEIRPSKAYQAIYHEMVDAIKTLYFIADSYKTPRKKGKGKNATVLPDYSPSELFEKYAAEELGTSDAEEGMEQIYAHKEFLILAMISGKEGLSWSKFPLYTHFYKKFPDTWSEMRQRMKPPTPGKASKARGKSARQSSVDTTSTTSSLKRKHGPPAKKEVEVISLDGSAESSSESRDEVLLAAVEGASKSQAPRTTKQTRRTRQNSVVEQAEDLATPAKEEDTDEETRLRARKNKSSLRPRASKASKSASRKGGKGPAAEEGDTDSEAAPSPTNGKRKNEANIDTRRPSKRRNSKPHDDEGIDIPTSPSVSGDADTAASPSDITDLPLRTLNHMPDPVQEDTWTCALDGCTHKVYGASRPESQKLIREHYTLHAFDDDERVQMVKKFAAPSLPANHLMDRVRQQAKIEGFPAGRQMASRYPDLAVAPGNATVQQRY
ncbi:hypothetical protein M409DRAFT_55827 [Zasmidium cellare ATCC 36951]|uniref:DNA (cytosine-5)-methyltransferase 1 replication foci domain-containing protein n=1 Tax=Zasmidium cellare ATCC 36951 TaxID=1080233 RepID=A0A6A6CGX0_ZASCE|nr:uncharacterized protein M409DRAFT_55827 [Zasmidium cellare ATCC 36951]KAF2165430.1 hypothetical protein M409DRAFT_55827 [Zasmidium cellare ATCC 36951]